MPQGPCMSCGGSGQRTEYQMRDKGDGTVESVPVQVSCYGCGGTGQQELPA